MLDRTLKYFESVIDDMDLSDKEIMDLIEWLSSRPCGYKGEEIIPKCEPCPNRFTCWTAR